VTIGVQREGEVRLDDTLQRLPYYGVFDFLTFGVKKGIVMLHGYAYPGSLKSDAARAVKRVSGISGVAKKITVVPASPNDDRIRWPTFCNIYTDDSCRGIRPAGRWVVLRRTPVRHVSGTQPSGNYPIHIIVQKGRTTLLGIVDNESDNTVAGFKAREITGVFAVQNELVISKN
jgi:hypothetical protein